jgi:hypothetical protein
VPDDGAVTVTLRERERGKPPLSWLRLDVRLRNDELVPRWFLVPAVLSASWEQGGDTVERLDAFALQGTGRVVLGRLRGARDWHVVRVPGAGEIVVRGLAAMAFDEELPDGPFPVDVLVAAAITLGGRPAEELFPGGDPTSDARAEVDAEPAEALGSWTPPEPPVVLAAPGARTYAAVIAPGRDG